MAMEDATRIKNTNDGLVLRSITEGKEYPLKGEMLVGREVECAIQLNSDHASRYHAKLNVAQSGIYVEDLNSTNGTFVNGEKAKGRIRLSLGDEVRFDDVSFRLASLSSGSEDTTSLAPRGRIHRPQASQKAHPSPRLRNSTPSTPIPSTSTPRAPAVKKRPAPAKKPVTPSLHQVNVSSPRPEKPQQPASEQWQPETIAAEENGDNTQLMSPVHMDRLVERNKNDLDVNIGAGARFIVMTAPLRGKLFELEGATIGTHWSIGRDSSSEIQLTDKTISVDHALLTKTDTGLLLTPTNAKNAILINGKPLNRALLAHNDKIQIGRTELLFRTDTPSESEISALEASQAQELGSNRFTIIATIAVLVVLFIAFLTTSK